jgi:hypothetical protein
MPGLIPIIIPSVCSVSVGTPQIVNILLMVCPPIIIVSVSVIIAVLIPSIVVVPFSGSSLIVVPIAPLSLGKPVIVTGGILVPLLSLPLPISVLVISDMSGDSQSILMMMVMSWVFCFNRHVVYCL